LAQLSLYDVQSSSAEALAQRLRTEYPKLQVSTDSKDPAGHDLVVNGTPLGMNPGDPLPVNMERLSPQTFVGEVVMRTEMTAFLSAAQARGCRIQVGSDMLFEMIPAYLEFFDYPTTTADELRRVARL
jgi:shikimate dehydrogenase